MGFIPFYQKFTLTSKPLKILYTHLSLKEWCSIQNHFIRHEIVALSLKVRPNECGKKVIRENSSLAHEKEQLGAVMSGSRQSWSDCPAKEMSWGRNYIGRERVLRGMFL